MANVIQSIDKERENQDAYMRAEIERRKAELRPSKLHTMPLVAYIERGGQLIPVYREEV